MKKKYLFLALLFPLSLFSQTEKYPTFSDCKNNDVASIEKCFYTNTKKIFFENFETPAIIEKENYTATTNAIFTVTKEGAFKLIYINTPYNEIKTAVKNAFDKFPDVAPATYNNHAIEMKFELPIQFPITDNFVSENTTSTKKIKKESLIETVAKKKLADATFLEHNSNLNIPFNHRNYVDYEFALHQADGTHSASKPYTFNEISPYYNLSEEKKNS